MTLKNIDLLKPLFAILIALIAWIYTTDRNENKSEHMLIEKNIKQLNNQQIITNSYMQNMDARHAYTQKEFEKFYNESKAYWRREK